MAENILSHNSYKILVVEDEAEIRGLISMLLLRQGYQVELCASATIAQEKMNSQRSGVQGKSHYDLIILDWMMPGLSGLDFLKDLQRSQRGQTHVLMVTAKAEPKDIVHGLESGADDYVTKPFDPAIFLARVRALLRRSAETVTDASSAAGGSSVGGLAEKISIGSLVIDLARYEVHIEGGLVHMTPSEFKILSEMAMNRGRVMTRDHLVEVVQGEGISVTGRTIDTHVFGMRKKMGSAADCIETIRGVGYRIRSE